MLPISQHHPLSFTGAAASLMSRGHGERDRGGGGGGEEMGIRAKPRAIHETMARCLGFRRRLWPLLERYLGRRALAPGPRSERPNTPWSWSRLCYGAKARACSWSQGQRSRSAPWLARWVARRCALFAPCDGNWKGKCSWEIGGLRKKFRKGIHLVWEIVHWKVVKFKYFNVLSLRLYFFRPVHLCQIRFFGQTLQFLTFLWFNVFSNFLIPVLRFAWNEVSLKAQKTPLNQEIQLNTFPHFERWNFLIKLIPKFGCFLFTFEKFLHSIAEIFSEQSYMKK